MKYIWFILSMYIFEMIIINDENILSFIIFCYMFIFNFFLYLGISLNMRSLLMFYLFLIC